MTGAQIKGSVMADLISVAVSAAVGLTSGGLSGVLLINTKLTRLETQVASILEKMHYVDGDSDAAIANRAGTEARLASVERNTSKIEKLNDDVIRLKVQSETVVEGQKNMTRTLENVRRELGGLTSILNRKGALFEGNSHGDS
jgi:hypothetical protein